MGPAKSRVSKPSWRVKRTLMASFFSVGEVIALILLV